MFLVSQELIGTKEAASILGVSKTQVNRLVKNGILDPVGRLGSRRVNIFQRAIVESLAETTKK